MITIKVRGISEQNLARIDRIVDQLNKNSSKKISRNMFLREEIEKIPLNFQKQDEISETSLLIQKQNRLLQEYLRALNILVKYFMSGEREDTEKGMNLLDDLANLSDEEDK
ncbi:hypothetical protein EJK17_03270 [Lactobacillus xujianguonis]|uniref:Uncharacterized protein n=1 Tax=Lactobacillus xujianguonis TaxID=2495899 RepID=A0A437SWC3_9LACO|nr:hypothetical protein [Lactobacillus xujianguonis]RVU71231.1 hypothetical protein EJK17_03270 [Lactobacillus xujianguonis]